MNKPVAILHKKNFTIRPTTTTRPPFRITVIQAIAPNGEVAQAEAILVGRLADYLEKPEYMRDLAHVLHCAAGYMEELDQNVKR